MADYTQNDIDTLISCNKEVSSPPKKGMKACGAHLRNDATLVASNGEKGEFSVFIRQSVDFPENFSVGLTYHPNDSRSEITLLRCNGKHGDYNRSPNPSHAHFDYHVHRATEDAVASGLKPERDAAITTEYASIEEAIQYFIGQINLDAEDAAKYFSAGGQFDFQFTE